nr:MAG TPA: hypothetical protein [Caudoviricetes sp.]
MGTRIRAILVSSKKSKGPTGRTGGAFCVQKNVRPGSDP